MPISLTSVASLQRISPCSLLLISTAASFDNGDGDFVYSWRCPLNTPECNDERAVSAYGWVMVSTKCRTMLFSFVRRVLPLNSDPAANVLAISLSSNVLFLFFLQIINSGLSLSQLLFSMTLSGDAGFSSCHLRAAAQSASSLE